MVDFEIILTKQARKDVLILKEIGLFDKADELVRIIKANPFQSPPAYEKLSGRFKRYVFKAH